MTHGGAREGAGRKPSKTPTRDFSIRISEELYRQLERSASRDEISINRLITATLKASRRIK